MATENDSERASKRKPLVAFEIEDRWRRKGIEGFLTAEGFEIGGRRAGVVLLDAPRPWTDVREALLRTRSRFPVAAILVFVREVRRGFVEPCLHAGAMGVLRFNAEPPEILAAIEAVARGDMWAPRNLMASAIQPQEPSKTVSEFNLTRAERRVLEALRDDPTNKEIAGLLGVSQSTVKFHISRLLRKTGTAHRRDLVRLALGSRS